MPCLRVTGAEHHYSSLCPDQVYGFITNLIGYKMHQLSGGWHVIGSGEGLSLQPMKCRVGCFWPQDGHRSHRTWLSWNLAFKLWSFWWIKHEKVSVIAVCRCGCIEHCVLDSKQMDVLVISSSKSIRSPSGATRLADMSLSNHLWWE